MSDMPRLNDARRVARIAFVIDELCYATRHDQTKSRISPPEFEMLGGIASLGKTDYSFYRQVVYSRRDAMHMSKYNMAPAGKDVVRANKMFVCYDTDDEALEDDGPTSLISQYVMPRIACVLSESRRAMRLGHAINDWKMSHASFVRCGGHKLVSQKRKLKGFSLKRQLVLAKRGLRQILEDVGGRFPRKSYDHAEMLRCRKEVEDCTDATQTSHLNDELKKWEMISEDEEEEDVDDLDDASTYVSVPVDVDQDADNDLANEEISDDPEAPVGSSSLWDDDLLTDITF